MAAALAAAAVAYVVGAAGGWVFSAAGLPLPWMLGSLAATAVMGSVTDRWSMPPPVRTLARPVIGVLAGSAFTPAIVAMLPSWWPIILLVVAYTIFVAALGFLFFRRVCRFDPATAYFSATPGGIAEMLMLGASYGARPRTILVVHVVRIVAMVTIIPFAVQLWHGPLATGAPPVDRSPVALLDWVELAAIGAAGYALGRYSRFPGGEMTASMLISAALHGAGVVGVAPSGAVIIPAQILIGAVAGARLAGVSRSELRTLAAPALGWAVVLLVTAAVTSLAAAPLVGTEPLTLLFGLASGGTAEMIMMAIAIGGEVAIVSICQVVRILLVLTGAPLLFSTTAHRWR